MTRNLDESEKLIDLAKRMDQESASERRIGESSRVIDNSIECDSIDGEDLSNDESQQLGRIQEALQFLNGVRFSKENPEAVDTVAGLQQETLTNQSDQAAISDSADQTDKRIDRFKIIRLLGKGGFAKVWLAHDPRLDRHVAVKILNPSLYASQEVAARFDREASIAATLADALQHAHQRGIVHRDLKPANVLIDQSSGSSSDRQSEVTDLDERSAVKALRIADFGLARLLNSTDQNATVEGAIIGTPAYMSPEQATGACDIGTASDIYSLGVMLYELLTGRVPILGDSNIDTLLAIRQLEPKRPSTINKNIPADLEAICLKCLRKNPDRRYKSAWELGEDLRRWLSGQVVAARRPGISERFRKWVIRNPALTTAIAAISAGLLFSGLQWRNARTQADRAQRNVVFAQETITDLVQRTAGDSSIPAELRMKLVERAVSLQTRLLEEEPDNDQVIFQTAWTFRQLADVSNDIREYQAALDALDAASGLLSEIKESSPQYRLVPPAGLAIKMIRSNVLNSLGRHDEVIGLFAEELEATNPYQLASALQNSGKAKWDSGDLEGALIDLNTSTALRVSAAGESLMLAGDVAITLLYQGSVESDLGQTMEAANTLARALDYQTTVISSTSFHESMEETMARIQYQLGMVKCQRDQFESGMSLLSDAEARFKMLSQWNKTKPRYPMQWFGASAEICRMNIQAGEIADATEVITEMESRFEAFDSGVKEYLEFGLILAEDHIGIAKHWKANSGQPKEDFHFERAEHWLDEMEEQFPGDDSISNLRDQLEDSRN